MVGLRSESWCFESKSPHDSILPTRQGLRHPRAYPCVLWGGLRAPVTPGLFGSNSILMLRSCRHVASCSPTPPRCPARPRQPARQRTGLRSLGSERASNCAAPAFPNKTHSTKHAPMPRTTPDRSTARAPKCRSDARPTADPRPSRDGDAHHRATHGTWPRPSSQRTTMGG